MRKKHLPYLVAVSLLASGASVAAVFELVTFDRNFAWKDAVTLRAKVQSYQPDNPRANYHLAVKAEEEKDFPRAIELNQRATRYYPKNNWNPDSKSIGIVKEKLARFCYELAVKLYNSLGNT